MKGFQVCFNVFANSQEEADKASIAIRQFIDNNAKMGIAVTANKLVEAIAKWGDSFLVNSYLRK